MIVGTAGHIDHGKTTLVKALTGVDTDRLPEEKKRGISIELGYAYLDLPADAAEPGAARSAPPSGDAARSAQTAAAEHAASSAAAPRIGFIDVPGHERLVHTMLAGATGIDLALLLVAADDGPMPQTREHLAVLSLLGIARGAAVVTKTDRVDAARVAAVRDEVAALLEPTPLAGAPVLALSAASGEGVEALRHWLFEQARGFAARADDGAFRLAVDRAFTLDGVGTVVTGTVHAGRVQVGDELVLVPAPDPPRVRVRSLHAQNRPVRHALAGQRCALALAGVDKDAIVRGQWLVPEAAAAVSDRLDVRLTLWHAEPKALRSGTPVHVHLGAAAVEGTVAVLDAGLDAVAPGGSARVQLVLRAAVGAWRGDRVVLRDASASRTLAGGVVIDPFAPARYRRTPQRMAELEACERDTPRERLAALLAAAANGVDLRRWQRAEGGLDTASIALPDAALRSSEANADLALDAQRAAVLADAAVAALADYHARQPEELGPDAGRLRRLAAPRLPEPLWRALLARLLGGGRVAQRGAFVHLPEHGIRLSAVDERIAQKVAPLLDAAGFEGAWVRDLARDLRESEALMRTTLARLAQRGELHQAVKDLFYPAPTMRRLAALAREVGAAHAGEVTAARFRDATQLGRKRAIQVLEYFDRVGLLRRVGDVHRLRGDTDLFREAA